MKKSLVVLGIVLFALVGTSSAQKKEYRLAMAMQTLQNPFYLSMKAGAEKAAAELGNVKLTIVGAEHSTDLTTQVKQIEDFIQMKMDVIGVVAIEKKGIIPTIEKVNRPIFRSSRSIPTRTEENGNAILLQIMCWAGASPLSGLTAPFTVRARSPFSRELRDPRQTSFEWEGSNRRSIR
jgi:hypothetical protein